MEITKDTLIGDLIKACPWAEPIIEKYLGRGCFTCPGVKLESIAFGAMMHRQDPQIILQELWEEAARFPSAVP